MDFINLKSPCKFIKTLKLHQINLFFLLTFAILLIDRIFFDRDLFADGSCHFLQYYLDHFIDLPIIGRILGTALMHLPAAILSGIGLHPEDLDIARLVYKIGYVIPFLIAYYLISFLDEGYKNFGIDFLIFSILVFYLPNSIFVVGEFTLAFAFLPVFLSSSLNYFYSGNDRFKNNSLYIFIISTFILMFTYEAVAFFTICFIFLLNFLLAKKNKFKLVTTLKNEIVPLFIMLFAILIFGLSFLTMPEWLKANAHSGFRGYLTQYKTGALYDSYVYFQIIVFLSLLASIFVKKLFKNTIKLTVLFLIASFFLLNINHLPIHSYYSKTIFLLIYFSIAIIIILFKANVNEISINLRLIARASLIPVCFYIFIQAFENNQYLKDMKSVINDLPENSFVNIDELDFYKLDLSKKYTWSWGHLCVSTILKPINNSVILGEFDRDYPPSNKIKAIINEKKQFKN